MLLFVEAEPATASPARSPWLAIPLFAPSLLGITRLVYSIRGLIRLSSPAENSFTFSAAEPRFRFKLTRPGQYDVGCTRSGRWGRRFTLPPVLLEVPALPGGVVQRLIPPSRGYTKQSNMSGATTLRFDTFRPTRPVNMRCTTLVRPSWNPATSSALCPPRASKWFSLS